MTDNFDKIKNWLAEQNKPNFHWGREKFYVVRLVRRGKDNKNIATGANRVFKYYFINYLSQLEELESEIKLMCDTFNLRAYINVGARYKKKALKSMLQKVTDYVIADQYDKLEHIVDSAMCSESDEKWFVVDCDDCVMGGPYTDNIKTTIYRVGLFDAVITLGEQMVLMEVPTKTGCHLITRPFNVEEFTKEVNKLGITMPDIKKNWITLLYENIK